MRASEQAIQLRRSARIERYRRDFEAFAREVLTIKPASGPICPFDLSFKQRKIESILAAQYKQRGFMRHVEYKCRQHGGTTHAVARCFHAVHLNENTSSLTIAQDDTTVSNAFNMAQLFYDSMLARAPDIAPVRRYLNRQEIVLENPDVRTRWKYPGLRSNMQIQSAVNMHAGTGTTRQWLHISELAKFKRVDEIKSSLYPAVHLLPNTGIIIESAPFSFGDGRDEFRNKCDEARSGKSIWSYSEVLWHEVPEYSVKLDPGERLHLTEDERFLKRQFKLTDEQLKFRRTKIQEFGTLYINVSGEEAFRQEYPVSYEDGWIQYNALVFPRRKLDELELNRELIHPPLYNAELMPGPKIYHNPEAPLSVWVEPVLGRRYDIGVDTAIGVQGGNYSVAEVIDRETGEQCAEFHAHIEPLDFAKYLYWLGYWYNQAQVGIEIEGIGYAVNEALGKMLYANRYIWRHRDSTVPGKLSHYTGWKTQQDSKKLMVAHMRHELIHDTLRIHSIRLLREMRQYCVEYSDAGNEMFAAAEGNDDCIAAFQIALIIRSDETFGWMNNAPAQGPPSLAQRNEALRRAIMDSPGLNGTLMPPQPVDRLTDRLAWLADEMKGVQ